MVDCKLICEYWSISYTLHIYSYIYKGKGKAHSSHNLFNLVHWKCVECKRGFCFFMVFNYVILFSNVQFLEVLRMVFGNWTGVTFLYDGKYICISDIKHETKNKCKLRIYYSTVLILLIYKYIYKQLHFLKQYQNLFIINITRWRFLMALHVLNTIYCTWKLHCSVITKLMCIWVNLYSTSIFIELN